MEENSNIEKISYPNGVEVETLKSHRKEKNVIMVLICAILFVCICITVYVGSKSVTVSPAMSGNPPMDNNAGQMQGMQPPTDMTPPDKPEGMNDNMTPPDMQNMNGATQSSSLKISYYVAFVMESLLLSSVAIYLLMSNFNERSLQQTLGKASSKVMYMLTILIQTALLTVIEYLITTKVL